MRRPKITSERSKFRVENTQDFLQRPALFRNSASRIADIIFQDIYEYYAIKESIALQLVCNLKILLIGDSGCSKSSFLNRIKENFNFVELIPHYCGGDLPSDKSVLAFAVPKQGRFNLDIPISEQIKVEPFFLNQFDILFIMRDVPNKERDKKIAEKIIRGEKEVDLRDIRKKIFKLRKLKPIWSVEAETRLVEFYVNIRNMPCVKKPAPLMMTSKILKSIKSFCEGYAKLRESNKISKEDADNAIKLFKFYTTQLNDEEDEDE